MSDFTLWRNKSPTAMGEEVITRKPGGSSPHGTGDWECAHLLAGFTHLKSNEAFLDCSRRSVSPLP